MQSKFCFSVLSSGTIIVSPNKVNERKSTRKEERVFSRGKAASSPRTGLMRKATDLRMKSVFSSLSHILVAGVIGVCNVP